MTRFKGKDHSLLRINCTAITTFILADNFDKNKEK